jgi:hypothetical protein
MKSWLSSFSLVFLNLVTNKGIEIIPLNNSRYQNKLV